MRFEIGNAREFSGKTVRFVMVMVLLLFLLLLGLVINANTGSVSIPAGDVFRMIFQRFRTTLSAMTFFQRSAAALLLRKSRKKKNTMLC